LGMLRKAKNVAIAEIPEQGGGRSEAVARVRDVVAWLSRHGVTAAELVPEIDQEQTTMARLDAIAADVGAGVVVAGAYGHSRFRELILGGMTQHLISQSARCVLLSH
jgi:nucleotide-binding universal stress UspA family protein